MFDISCLFNSFEGSRKSFLYFPLDANLGSKVLTYSDSLRWQTACKVEWGLTYLWRLGRGRNYYHYSVRHILNVFCMVGVKQANWNSFSVQYNSTSPVCKWKRGGERKESHAINSYEQEKLSIMRQTSVREKKFNFHRHQEDEKGEKYKKSIWKE